MNCLNCKKTLTGKQKKFCSGRCGRIYWNSKHKNLLKESYNKFKGKEDWKSKKREYHLNRKSKDKTRWKKWQEKKHKKELKNKEVHKARRHDYLKRSNKCKFCGATKNLEFHHTDYKLKKGFTLCSDCHKQLHKSREVKK
jgi:hypothetical protein